MNRIFKRPMFRKGGEVGGGIMTGIVEREKHAESDEEGVGNQRTSGPAIDKLMKIMEQYPVQSVDPVSQLLVQGGLRGFSETGGGSTFGNLAKAFEPAVGQFYENVGKQDRFKRDIALTGAELDIEQQQAKDLLEKEGEIKKQVAAIGGEDSAKIQTANAVKAVYAPKIKSLEDKIIAAKQSGATPEELQELVTDLQNLKIQAETSYLDVLIPGKSRSEQVIDLAAVIKENDVTGQKTTEEIIREAEQIVDMASGISRANEADGGRIGYAMGSPENMSMETPEVEPKTSSVDMTFAEFRQKLPANITDDIANILYYNSSAFADFANIETQDDVYSFNSKYDVNLTLPFDTETT